MLAIWLLLVSATAVIISVDHRRRLAAARRANMPLFEVGKPGPYLALALVSTVLPLPVYFYATRKSWKGIALGLAWAAGIVVIAVPVVQFADARLSASRAAAGCEETHKRCDYAAQFYRFGSRYLAIDTARANALLDVGCDGGDTECCIRLEGIFSLANDKARELDYRNKTVDICRKSPATAVGCESYLPSYGAGGSKPRRAQGELTPAVVAP